MSLLVDRAIQRLRDNIAKRESIEDVEALKAVLVEMSKQKERADTAEMLLRDLEGQGAPCYYCGKPCNHLAADPGQWPIALCHRDEPGVVKWHHERCVSERLIENQPAVSEKPAHVHRCMSCGGKWYCPHPTSDCKAGEAVFPSLVLRGPDGPTVFHHVCEKK